MNKLFNKCNFLFFILFSCISLYGQTNDDTPTNDNMRFTLIDDTLFSNTGLKLVIGQKLTIGNAGGEKGEYRSIISKKAAIVPSIWGQDGRYENAIENYVDSKKNKEKVKASLIPGNILTIKKIGFWTNSKPHFYVVYLSSDTDGYNCDIKLALNLKELLL